tara:strand:+ start:21826 stop:22080 length:255 start_codon:yes stop_codon:yes gene_type:complete
MGVVDVQAQLQNLQDNPHVFMMKVIDKVKHRLDGLMLVGERTFCLYDDFVSTTIVASKKRFACTIQVIVERDDDDLEICKGGLN